MSHVPQNTPCSGVSAHVHRHTRTHTHTLLPERSDYFNSTNVSGVDLLSSKPALVATALGFVVFLDIWNSGARTSDERFVSSADFVPSSKKLLLSQASGSALSRAKETQNIYFGAERVQVNHTWISAPLVCPDAVGLFFVFLRAAAQSVTCLTRPQNLKIFVKNFTSLPA